MTTTETYGKRATRSFAWNHFYKLSEFGLLNIYTMIIARHFGPIDSAPFVVYAAAGTSLSVIGAFAVDGVLLRYIPRIGESGTLSQETSVPGATDLSSFVRKLFAFRLFIVFALISLLFLCILFFTGTVGTSDTFTSLRDLAPVLSMFMLAQGIVAFSTFSLIGLLRTKRVFFCSVIARGAMLVGALLLILTAGEFSITNAILIHVSGAALNALLLLTNIRHVLRPVSQTAEMSFLRSLRAFTGEMYGFVRRPSTIKALLISPVMLYGMMTWGSDILGIFLGRQADILMIRAMWGGNTPEVGYYNVGSLVLLLTEYIFLLGFGGALVSVLSKLAQDDERDVVEGKPVNYERVRRGGNEIVGFQHVTLVPFCAFVFMFSLPIVRAIYGDQYDASALLVQYGIVALVLNIVFFHGGLHITSLMSIGKQHVTFRSRLAWAAVGLIANYFLIRSFGALGAMIGTNCVNMLACGTEWYFARKYIGKVGNLLSSVKICTISVVAAVGIYQLMQVVDLRQGPIVELLVATPVFFLVVYSLFYLFRLPETDVVLARLKKAFA